MALRALVQHARSPVLLFMLWLQITAATPGPCEVETGQSSIIVDIEESLGQQTNQSTIPAELPIVGDPGVDVALSTVFPKGPTLFQLDGKRLQLLQPLDRDSENLSHMVFQLVCQVVATKKRRTIPVIVRVSDINDNAPSFQGTPYQTTISELTPIGTTIFDHIKAVDIDAGVNGLAEYFIVPGDNKTLEENYAEDGYGYFSIALPHQGQVTVNRTLDYERTQKYLVTIVASDRARDTKKRLSSSTTLTVNVKDDDDQDPSFIYKGCSLHDGACINPEYTSYVNSGVLAGLLSIEPEKIQAVDMDTLNAKIKYSIESGEPESWPEYFAVDQNSGAVRQLKAVDTSVSKKFQLVIKAEEISESRRFTTARLSVTVRPVDASPPVVSATVEEGRVEENSAKGTRVLDGDGRPMRLSVYDPDLGPGDPIPSYSYEITTNYFAIDDEGYVVVNDERLDRDPPNPDTFRFQVVAREAGGAASAPLSLAVRLLDQNDNAPVIPKTQPATVPASLDPSPVYKVEATDIDEGENARITYSIYHVSNNGGNKFTIDPETGVISNTGRLSAGEQYSVTVRATDTGGLWSQGILELSVAPGPNTRPPQFSSRDYHAHVSEGAAINSTVTTVTAKDPENEQVTYAIVSGNDLRQFAVGANTGIITVIRTLDREVLTRYQLMIRAEDPGKLASTATVNIKVTDINDNNPEFEQEAYQFSVKEGISGAPIGRVHATDADEGTNAVVSYSAPHGLPFTIDNATGVITTNTELDYEHIKEYSFVVTATDGAPDRRLGTASVLVAVLDAPDEVPVFRRTEHVARVPENAEDYPVVKVEAEDPDTIPEITYTIIRGDTELFSIDRKSGMIRTLRPLDREAMDKHEIVVGTEENSGEGRGAYTTVEVYVDDVNDNAPIFTSVIRPITIEDSSSIGSLVQSVTAIDADATSPNNKIRYKLVGRGKSSIYFHVEPDTGAVRVRDDLRKEADSEYTVDVQAFDNGDPVMSSVSSLTVYVSHSATVPPDVGLGFADTFYTEHIAENSPNGSLVRVLPLLNKRAHAPQATPLKCRLAEDKHIGTFYVKLNDDRDCAIYLNTSTIDYETITEYSLEVQLESIKGLINPESSKANIKVHVTDVNDNAPIFVFPEQSSIGSAKGKYYAIVTQDMLLGTNVLQVKAKDKDSGDFGKIEYQKNSWSKSAEEYFSLDPDTGVISNIKTFENVPKEKLPFKLSVTARDNPNSANDYNVARASVVINLLQKDNQLVIEISNLNPDLMRRQSRSLLSAIEDKTGLIAGVEKLTTRHYLGENGTLEKDEKGTDVWLYLIEPGTGEILTRESAPVKKVLPSVSPAVSARLQTPAAPPHAPLSPPSPPRITPASPPLASALPAALLALAALVLLAASAATMYICASWNRYKRHKQAALQQYGSLPPPRPPSGYESSEDEPAPRYETQVLNMAVDDADLQLDFSPNNHAFNIHSVQYFSKDNGERSPTLSETATTARASSVNENGGTLNNRMYDTMPNNHIPAKTQTLNRRANNNHPLNNALGTLPRANNGNGLLAATLGRKMNGGNHKKKTTQPIMAYDEIPGLQRASDNDNVTFGKRNFSGYNNYDQSPIETTTEL